LALLKSLGEDLKLVFIASVAGVAPSADGTLSLEGTPSTAAKGERCWH